MKVRIRGSITPTYTMRVREEKAEQSKVKIGQAKPLIPTPSTLNQAEDYSLLPEFVEHWLNNG